MSYPFVVPHWLEFLTIHRIGFLAMMIVNQGINFTKNSLILRMWLIFGGEICHPLRSFVIQITY
ncbi:MAG: hypothetical protein MUF72_08305 [Elainella sp. Prado103]|nr:hypothetical protein [Elainella sp. Prado103]